MKHSITADAPQYRTTHDAARVMRQSEETARRVFRELWPRDEANDWRVGPEKWLEFMRHVAFNPDRRFGCRRRRDKPSPPIQNTLL